MEIKSYNKALKDFKELLELDHIKYPISHTDDVKRSIRDVGKFCSNHVILFPSNRESLNSPSEVIATMKVFKEYKKHEKRGHGFDYPRDAKEEIIGRIKRMFEETATILKQPDIDWS